MLRYFCFITLCILAACTVNEVGAPGQNGVSDKQIRLPLGNNIATSLTTATRTSSQYDLIKFNRANYLDLDSIVFTTRLRVSDATDSCIVELVNLSTNAIIANARVRSNSTDFVWRDSRNILSNLPSSQIDLGVQVRSKTGKPVEGGQSYLFLYR